MLPSSALFACFAATLLRCRYFIAADACRATILFTRFFRLIIFPSLSRQAKRACEHRRVCHFRMLLIAPLSLILSMLLLRRRHIFAALMPYAIFIDITPPMPFDSAPECAAADISASIIFDDAIFLRHCARHFFFITFSPPMLLSLFIFSPYYAACLFDDYATPPCDMPLLPMIAAMPFCRFAAAMLLLMPPRRYDAASCFSLCLMPLRFRQLFSSFRFDFFDKLPDADDIAAADFHADTIDISSMPRYALHASVTGAAIR